MLLCFIIFSIWSFYAYHTISVFKAAQNGNLQTVKSYLAENQKSEVYLNATCGGEFGYFAGATALVLAAHNRHIDIIKHLLAAGVSQKYLALYHAAAKDCLDIVQILLARIRDPKKLDRVYTEDKFTAEGIAQNKHNYDCAMLIRVRKQELKSNWRFRSKLFNKNPSLDLDSTSITPESAPVLPSAPVFPSAPLRVSSAQPSFFDFPPLYSSTGVTQRYEATNF
jgi:hypothetical protein